MTDLSVYDNDPTLYLFTSLTAGSSHIVTATSRIETILKANKVPFKGVDTATDDLARKLYGRRARGKKLPLLVKEGYVLADLEQIEEWNEYDELKEALGVTAAPAPAKPTAAAASSAPKPEAQEENAPPATSQQNLAIRQLGAEAAKVAASKKPAPGKIATTNPLLSEKVNSPAATTPKKTPTGGILSPRSIPLPSTPNPATEEKTDAQKFGIPKVGNVPVKMPPSMHADAANPDLDAGPIAASRKSPTESPNPPPGSALSSGSEASSSEEEDEADEKPTTKLKESLPLRPKAEPPTSAATKVAVEESDDDDEDGSDEEEERPQMQDAKAAGKAGDSVKD